MTNKMKNHKITKLGGLNNSNYLLECENNKYVLRIPSKDNKNNFSEENFVLIFANLNKLSPPIIYHNKDNGILISKFLEDSKVNMSTFTSLEFLEKLSINLKKLHILKCEHIFNPFVREEKSRNSKKGGSGLGLTISKEIVEKHGGTIYLSDGPLKGCNFVIELPRK
ncbi:ATP-binding protein [Clostridium perfringens]|uniref:ATP-binding protein n=1 Tax=Clostridium perfringens TaxID=1502 RepID=UPI002245B246|nr:hypothetical protein [Clostridium perfringens]